MTFPTNPTLPMTALAFLLDQGGQQPLSSCDKNGPDNAIENGQSGEGDTATESRVWGGGSGSFSGRLSFHPCFVSNWTQIGFQPPRSQAIHILRKTPSKATSNRVTRFARSKTQRKHPIIHALIAIQVAYTLRATVIASAVPEPDRPSRVQGRLPRIHVLPKGAMTRCRKDNRCTNRNALFEHPSVPRSQ